MEVPENLPLPAEEVERNWEEGAGEEKPQKPIIDGTSTKHPLGSQGSPEDNRGEASVGIRASEVIFLSGCANTGDLRHLVVEDGCGNEAGNEGGEHLGIESYPRWNVGIMGELEILREVERVRCGDVSVD